MASHAAAVSVTLWEWCFRLFRGNTQERPNTAGKVASQLLTNYFQHDCIVPVRKEL